MKLGILEYRSDRRLDPLIGLLPLHRQLEVIHSRPVRVSTFLLKPFGDALEKGDEGTAALQRDFGNIDV